MSTQHLTTLRVGDAFYEHQINTETDATHFVDQESGEVVMTILFDCKTLDRNGAQIGMFRTESTGLWNFHLNDGTVIETPNKSLIKGETLVFKQLIEKNLI